MRASLMRCNLTNSHLTSLLLHSKGFCFYFFGGSLGSKGTHIRWLLGKSMINGLQENICALNLTTSLYGMGTGLTICKDRGKYRLICQTRI